MALRSRSVKRKPARRANPESPPDPSPPAGSRRKRGRRTLHIVAGEPDDRPGLLLWWATHKLLPDVGGGLQVSIPPVAERDQVLVCLAELEKWLGSEEMWNGLHRAPELVSAAVYDVKVAEYDRRAAGPANDRDVSTWGRSRVRAAELAIRQVAGIVFMKHFTSAQRLHLLTAGRDESSGRDAAFMIDQAIAELEAGEPGADPIAPQNRS